MWAKLWDMSHLFVFFVTLVIQCGAMAKFWPLHHYSQYMGKIGEKTLSTVLHRSWERGRGNMIFSPNTGWDVGYIMGHVPSLCVLCNSCYSKWCNGQILAIAPLQSMYGKE